HRLARVAGRALDRRVRLAAMDPPQHFENLPHADLPICHPRPSLRRRMEKSASEPNDSGAHDCAHRGWVKVVRNPLSPWVMLVRKLLPGWVMVVRNDRPCKLSFMPADGDIVVFDNWRVLHGREPVGGRHRRLHDRMW